MKKVFTILFLFAASMCFLMAQTGSVNSANRNTALRCLKLAENCLVGNDWDNALKQANLGLSYDENISDLIYLKAAALINMGANRADVIDIIQTAFQKNEWVGYSKNGARILYSDLLSDVGLYEQSMKILDENQMLYSADAEFIRIKNLYRMGTEASINSARLKLNSARRIYPADARFPNIFFMFEFIYLMENEKYNSNYKIPEIVRTIAAFYINKLPDYSGTNLEMELLASFFAEKEERIRIVNAIYAKNQTENPMLPIAALDAGVVNEQQAYEMFFNFSGNTVSLEFLQILISRLTDENVKTQLMEKLLNYDGIIEVDENYDLQSEISIEYETGRPVSVKYDRNNDGKLDLYSTCDFGAPKFVYFANNNTELFYDAYPGVSKIILKDEEYVLNYLQGDYKFTPFNLIPDTFVSQLGIDMYIPYINNNSAFPANEELLVYANSLEVPVSERENAKAVYTVMEGKFISADFYENSHKYAYCDFSTMPIVRFADYDMDEYFETLENYEFTGKDSSLYNKEHVIQSFGKVMEDFPLYLKKILIDRNGNTFFEFTEQYLENNGKICCWDNDDDGKIDCQYIRYPCKENDSQSLIEETIYYNKNEIAEIKLHSVDGIPVKMLYKENEVMIYAGEKDNFYWIEDEGSVEMEETVLSHINNGIVQGAVELIETEDKRISVICVGNSLYCKILPDSDIVAEESEEETPDDSTVEKNGVDEK